MASGRARLGRCSGRAIGSSDSTHSFGLACLCLGLGTSSASTGAGFGSFARIVLITDMRRRAVYMPTPSVSMMPMTFLFSSGRFMAVLRSFSVRASMMWWPSSILLTFSM